jgi:hypothetical protein
MEKQGDESSKDKEPKPSQRMMKHNGTRKDLPVKRALGDVNADNQLKAAVDILKSWDIFKKTIKN